MIEEQSIVYYLFEMNVKSSYLIYYKYIDFFKKNF